MNLLTKRIQSNAIAPGYDKFREYAEYFIDSSVIYEPLVKFINYDKTMDLLDAYIEVQNALVSKGVDCNWGSKHEKKYYIDYYLKHLRDHSMKLVVLEKLYRGGLPHFLIPNLYSTPREDYEMLALTISCTHESDADVVKIIKNAVNDLEGKRSSKYLFCKKFATKWIKWKIIHPRDWRGLLKTIKIK